MKSPPFPERIREADATKTDTRVSVRAIRRSHTRLRKSLFLTHGM
jgi:hypothetical protein